MYEKDGRGEHAYFVYAPPQPEHLDDEIRGPNRPFPGAEPWQCSVYYYWWAYLRENEAYLRLCHASAQEQRANAIFRDFGDVRSGSFIDWWNARGRDLFREPRESTEVIPLNGVMVGQADSWRAETRDNSLIVQVPLVADVELTVRKLRILLKQEIAARKKSIDEGQRRARLGASRYPVETKPVLTSLHQTLEVWKAYKKLGTGAAHHQIADAAGLPIHEITSASNASLNERKSKRVSALLSSAKKLIYNVGYGRFPDLSNPQQ